MNPGWALEERTGTAGDLHGRDFFQAGPRAITWCRFTNRALVLGSTQSDADVDATRARTAGVEIVRRRTGGGAVLVAPGDVVWIDLVIRPGDRLWDDDVGRSFLWVGRAWAGALRAVLDPAGDEPVVHTGAMRRGPWSASACFAGLGHGEVTVGGRKVVGLAQRRGRDGALFQAAALLHWRPDELLGLLRLPDGARPEVAVAAAGLSGLAGDRLEETAVVEALVAALPD